MTANRAGNGTPSILTAQLAAHAAQAAPHGPAPAFPGDLPIVEAAADLAGRIVALAANGHAAEEQSPHTAAACWHEAGRLLAGRAGRPAEAWLCHSRALAVHPELHPARQALRRLTSLAGDAELLIGIIDAEIDHAADEAEIAALLAERAAAELALGRAGVALGTLRDAARTDPGALVPRLMFLAGGGATSTTRSWRRRWRPWSAGGPAGPTGRGSPACGWCWR